MCSVDVTQLFLDDVIAWKWTQEFLEMVWIVYLNDHMSGTQDVILGNCFVFELLHQNHNDIEYNTLT